MCRLGIERPIGVSGDVHQATWSVFLAGAELPSPHRPLVAAEPVRAGRWRLRPRLTGRPPGPLPERSAGASPAYDLLERGGEIASIEVDLDARPTDLRRGDDAGVRSLLAAMARAHPLWGAGWEVAPDSEVVVALEGDRPAAAAVIRDGGRGLFAASRVSILPGVATPATGSALVDALEAVTLGRGGWQLRFDGSVFLHADAVRVARHGYAAGPPSDGAADVPAWAQRDLRDPPA